MSLATPVSFLGLPLEIRLLVYHAYLDAHRRAHDRRQPSNSHIRLLHTCRAVHAEAAPACRRYVSLRHERQIRAFVLHAPDAHAALVQCADVANDGRFVLDTDTGDPEPVSKLHLALRRMTGLRELRVFECRQGLPTGAHSLQHFSLSFELALFPRAPAPRLEAYELHVGPGTRVGLAARTFPPRALHTLRLAGQCSLPPAPDGAYAALRHLALVGVAGTHFELHPDLGAGLPGARLASFAYAQGDRRGLALRDRHLSALVLGPGAGAATGVAGTPIGAGLRRLALIECSHLSTATLATCLAALPQLASFALSRVTADELAPGFVRALPRTLAVLKLHVARAWYTRPALGEAAEREVCDALEDAVLRRRAALRYVRVCLDGALMEEGGRAERWRAIAAEARFVLAFGMWDWTEDV